MATSLTDNHTTLGIDHGTARIGLAISDPIGITARPLETVHTAKEPGGDPLPRIVALVEEHGVSAVVVGIPLRMDDSEGPQAETVRVFIGALKKVLPGDVATYEVDERLSTREAEAHLARAGKKGGRKANKELIDQTAAAVILQDFLNHHGFS
jgi:putative Holliday junction resolvase